MLKMEKSFKKRLEFLRQVEKELAEWGTMDRKEFSEACLQAMKHIYRMLRNVIYQVEVHRIERRKQEGRITPKEAVHQKAKVRKQYL